MDVFFAEVGSSGLFFEIVGGSWELIYMGSLSMRLRSFGEMGPHLWSRRREMGHCEAFGFQHLAGMWRPSPSRWWGIKVVIPAQVGYLGADIHGVILCEVGVLLGAVDSNGVATHEVSIIRQSPSQDVLFAFIIWYIAKTIHTL